MSSLLRILYSLPSSLISVPPYLLTRTRSPFLTSKGTFLPLSSVLPVPRATMMPSVGFSLALSGMMMPPFLTSFSSAGSTRTRSPRGLTLIAIYVLFVLFDLVSVNQIPPHSPREKDGSAPPGFPNGEFQALPSQNRQFFFSSTTSASMIGSSLPPSDLPAPSPGVGPAEALPALAFSEAAL